MWETDEKNKMSEDYLKIFQLLADTVDTKTKEYVVDHVEILRFLFFYFFASVIHFVIC